MEKLLAGFKARYGAGLEDKVCDVGKDSARRSDGDWPFACQTTDAIRSASQAEVALMNSGSFRADLKSGTFTKGLLFSMLPFDDQVIVVQLTGSALRQALQRSLDKKGEGAFLQISGATVSGKAGALEITVGGEPLSSRRLYKVAVNDFLAGGGDGYEVFVRAKSHDKLGLKVRDLVEKDLKVRKTVPEAIDVGRWKDLE
jgi:2',3'-cyclic-nucleotide 2'-phosphodiesterase (5'-nucleotidase family)